MEGATLESAASPPRRAPFVRRRPLSGRGALGDAPERSPAADAQPTSLLSEELSPEWRAALAHIASLAVKDKAAMEAQRKRLEDEQAALEAQLESDLRELELERSEVHKERGDIDRKLEDLSERLEAQGRKLERERAALEKERKAFEEEKASLKGEMARAAEELARKEAELEREKAARQEEAALVKKRFAPLNEIVSLNVGGTPYQIGSDTLRGPHAADSIFPAMLSGRHEIKKDDKGAYFIDRDGAAFRHVLCWLRDGPAWLAEAGLDRRARAEAMREAEWFRMTAFRSALMAVRRQEELQLVMSMDSVSISSNETWYIIDARWLKEWRQFVAPDSTAPPPGPVTNGALVLADGTVRPNLQKQKHYRGVNPRVWGLFMEVYGGGPPIPRRVVDIYSKPG